MILNKEQAIEICKKQPHSDVVVSCISKQNEVVRHINGKNYEARIKQVEGHETPAQKKLRVALSQPSTIPITKIIIDELNRWTNAQGTSKTYNFGDNRKLEHSFKNEVLSKVWKGQSMDYFVQNELKDALDQEFNGFFLVTKGYRVEDDNGFIYEKRGEYTVKVNEKDPYIPYIVFISIEDVVDFSKNGSNVDYIVYHYGDRIEMTEGGKEKTIKQFRIIDDATDRIVEKDGSQWSLIEDGDFAPKKNVLGYVPAIQVSNTNFDMNADGIMRSQLSFLVTQLDRYLEKDSQHIHSEILHAFPKHWMTGMKCPECEGEKQVINTPNMWWYTSSVDEGEHIVCPRCVGSGVVAIDSASAVAKVPQVVPEGYRAFNAEVGGYITPPIEILEYQEESLEKLRDLIIYTGTSNKNIVATKFKTATENNMNVKTLEDKIDDRLVNIEQVETFLTDAIARLHQSYKKSYQGSVIKYSRRLYYRPESEILIDIEAAKRSGLPQSYLKQLQIELYRSKYIHDPLSLKRMILLTNLENLVGSTVAEVTANQFISPFEKQYKIYFNDIIEQIEKENNVNILDFKGGNESKIREEIIKILNTKLIEVEPIKEDDNGKVEKNED